MNNYFAFTTGSLLFCWRFVGVLSRLASGGKVRDFVEEQQQNAFLGGSAISASFGSDQK
jgi:hypothetical protein